MPLLATDAAAQGAIPILSAVQGQAGETEYSVTLQLLGLMTVLTLLPSILLMMTHLWCPMKIRLSVTS